jgi:uncharacterized protein YdaU (DUF1376 family)
MSKLPWHKRYHSDALTGYQALDLEERGAYTTLLDLMYDRGEALQMTDRLLAGYLNVSVRKAASLLAALVAHGKISRLADGRLTNSRFEKERENALKTARKHAENGSEGGRVSAETRKKANDNKEGNQAPLEPSSSYTRHQKPELDTEGVSKDTPAHAPELPLSKAPVLVDLTTATAAFDAYNAMAGKAGLPRAQSLNEVRRRHIAHRLKECGGLDGWKAAMAKVAASSFLTGKVKPWRADLDFILQASSFTKIMEGSFDDRPHAARRGGNSIHDTFDAIDAYTAAAIARAGGSGGGGS